MEQPDKAKPLSGFVEPTFVGRFSENFNLFCPAEGAIVQCSYLVVKVEEKVADGDCGR